MTINHTLLNANQMKIKIFTVGGTIDKIYFDAKSEYEVGQPAIAEILKEAYVAQDFAVESIMQKDSLEMTDEDRMTIKKKISAEKCSRILLTHGTDTMVETGKSLMQIKGKTIVLTGSLAPACFKSSDAVFNIGFAFGVLQTLPAGVYIAMNGSVFEANKVLKNREKKRFETLTD